MTSMLSNIVSWRDRQVTRQTAERVDTDEHDDDLDHGDGNNNDEVNSITADDENEEEGQLAVSSNSNVSLVDDDDDDDDDASDEDEFDDEELGGGPAAGISRTVRGSGSSSRRSNTAGRRTLRLADLEEERELVRRRTSACVLLSSFILLRLWVQAVVSGDFGLLLLCLVFTSWTARFIRHTREREEALDRMINEWDSNAEDEVNDARLRRMSFQSQLALAIMQSQIQMMEGGHGHPDGGRNTPGVSDEAKGRWDQFTYQSSSGFLKSKMKPSEEHSMDKDMSESSDEEPHCSICLGEYEDSEKLVMLPCKHIYHNDCISSWCDNHTRCPLCNVDLEFVNGDDTV